MVLPCLAVVWLDLFCVRSFVQQILPFFISKNVVSKYSEMPAFCCAFCCAKDDVRTLYFHWIWKYGKGETGYH